MADANWWNIQPAAGKMWWTNTGVRGWWEFGSQQANAQTTGEWFRVANSGLNSSGYPSVWAPLI